MNVSREVAEKIEAAIARGEAKVYGPKRVSADPEADLAMDEKTFMWKIVALAESLGWSYYHTYDSRRSRPGYPDLHLWRMAKGDRPGRSLWIECKTAKGRLTGEQELVIGEMLSAGCEVHVFRPADWNKIEKLLATNEEIG